METDYKICPQCKSEFRPEINECPECGVPLILGKDTCPNCRSEDYAGGRCGACGFIDGKVLTLFCADHPGKKAKWTCTVCGRPLCRKCAHKLVDGGMRCALHSEIRPQGDLVPVYEAVPTELGILATALTMNGIEVTFSPEGKYSCCSCGPPPVKLLVGKEFSREAEAVLDRLLYCGKCQKAISREAPVCPHCGESFEQE